jgi:hypothetical protein
MPDERRPLTASFERFCACLNYFDVDYVIVGSEAVAFHGVPRYSVDFDTFVRATSANLFRVKAALERFGMPDLAAQVDAETWARSGATLRLGDPPSQIDILLQLSGIDYRAVAPGAVSSRYGDTPVKFIGLDDLIRNKRAAGRPKDLADVAALEAAPEE